MKNQLITTLVLGMLCSLVSLLQGQQENASRDYQYALIEAVK
jgi:hypothetical protein